MSAKLNAGVATSRGPQGLSDGGHVHPSCSNCDALLMDIWVTRPNDPFRWKVRCNCPFCGDDSFTVEVRGGFHYGGYGVTKDDDADADVPSTIVETFDIDGETYVFKIKKAPNGKPIRKR